jgi:putative peptide zinc metalloprotease protein
MLSPPYEIAPYSKGRYIVSLSRSNHFIVNESTAHLLDAMHVSDSLESAHQHFLKMSTYKVDYTEFAEFAKNVQMLLSQPEDGEKRRRSTYARFRLPLIDGALVVRHLSWLRVLFLPRPFTFLAVSAVLGATWIVCSMLPGLRLGENINPGMACLLLIAATFIHETGHALAGNAYGARPGKMGIGFYLFLPMAFVDMTDAWRLSRRQRVITDLAGPCVETVYAVALATVGNVANSPTSRLVAGIAIARVLFQLLPFFRTDGYWALSDLLQVPDLSKSGARALTDILRHTVRARFSDMTATLQAKWKWGFVLFGILNLACGAYLLFRTAGVVGRSVSDNARKLWISLATHQPVSLELTFTDVFGLLFAIFLLNSLWRMLRKWQKGESSTEPTASAKRA